MILSAHSPEVESRIQADLCVIGSGAGGSVVAAVAAEAGMRVVVLEAGGVVLPSTSNRREESMVPRLYWDAGARGTLDRAVRVHQGKGIGGSTLHNLNLCKRIPKPVLEGWQRTRKLDALGPSRWASLYKEVEETIGVRAIPQSEASRVNAVLRRGTDALGWRGGPLHDNRTGCVGSGFCELACSFDAKNNALKVFIVRAIEAGATVIHHARATDVNHRDGRVRGVTAIACDDDGRPNGRKIEIVTEHVCVSASATATAALLLHSRVPHPNDAIGATLRLHPAVVAVGDFDEEVAAWRGVPQTWECTELLDFDASEKGQTGLPGDGRMWIVPATAHPMAAATMIPGVGDAHRSWMERFAHLAAFTAMLHDRTRGQVAADGDGGPQIDYWPDAPDRRALMQGLAATARLLFAAGARRVIVPGRLGIELTSASQCAELGTKRLQRHAIEVAAVHPMGSIVMDDDPRLGAAASTGRVHGVEGLWVADGSLFPTSIGVPPQLSIYALGLHVGRHLASAG